MSGRALPRPVRDLAICLGFYTRLPLPRFESAPNDFAGAQWAAPLAGVLVGLIGGLIYAAGHIAGLPPLAAAALAIGSTMLVTGCLHEDGLCDTADGFGGGATREQKLEIMRDSRLGTFGAAALVVTILMRWSALAAIGPPIAVGAALVAAHAASRGLLPGFMRVVPLARSDGLAASAGSPPMPAIIVAALLAVSSLVWLGLEPAFVGLVCLFLWFVVLERLCQRQIGGRTGDVLGTLQQGGEIIVLLAAAAFAN